MTAKIKSINIHAFRGIADLEIPLAGKSLLLKGENGTGKSSLIEALEFFFTGKVSHLEGTQGISAIRHAPHVNFTEDQVSVGLTFDPGDIHLARTFTTKPIPPKNLTPYFSSASRGAFILKRSQILQFIDNKPADRFRALASIIGVEDLDDVELEMMRTRDGLKGELDASRYGLNLILEDLSKDLNASISSTDDVLPALNLLLEQSNLLLISNLKDIEAHAESMLKSVRSMSSADATSILMNATAQSKSTLFPNEFTDTINEFTSIAKLILDEKKQLEIRISKLLQVGQQIIEDEKLNSCPLCQQPIDRDSLLEELKKRNYLLHSLTENASRIRTLAASLMSLIRNAESRVSSLLSNIEKIEAVSIPSLVQLKESPIFCSIPKAIDDLSTSSKSTIGIIEPAFKQAEELWHAVEIEIENEIRRLGVTQEEKVLLQMVRLIGAASDKVNRSVIEQERIDDLMQLFDTAEYIYKIFIDVKKAKVTKIYDAIQNDIRRYYSIIHPMEEHTDITLRLRTGQRASTELRMKSFGRDNEDPRALTSEGHLDSLGLCIFLAFVKNFNIDCSLVLLDDVVTTIDSSHRSRVCDLLLRDFSGYQMIITTHDGIWYKEFVAAQNALGCSAEFLNLEISSWCLENGPRIDKYLPSKDIIRKKIQDNDKVGAGNLARQYLEGLLKHIAVSTNASVPVINWLSGTAGDLTPPARDRLSKLTKDVTYTKQVTDTFSRLERNAFFGNLLSHDNELAEQISIVEINDFYEAVLAIHVLVQCASCHVNMAYVKETSEYRCVNPKCSSQTIYRTK